MLITFLFTIILGVELGILLMIITSIFILVKYTSVPRTCSAHIRVVMNDERVTASVVLSHTPFHTIDLSILGRIASDGRYKDVSSFPAASVDPVLIPVSSSL